VAAWQVVPHVDNSVSELVNSSTDVTARLKQYLNNYRPRHDL